jgi:hypothetical protein
MWHLPNLIGLDLPDEATIRPNAIRYLETKLGYVAFAESVLERLASLEEEL